MAPVSEVAKEKYFCPLLIWGWLRKGRMSEGGEKGEEEREEWRDRRPEGGLLEYPLYLWAERQRKKGGRKEGMTSSQKKKKRLKKRREGDRQKEKGDKRKRQTLRKRGQKKKLNC